MQAWRGSLCLRGLLLLRGLLDGFLRGGLLHRLLGSGFLGRRFLRRSLLGGAFFAAFFTGAFLAAFFAGAAFLAGAFLPQPSWQAPSWQALSWPALSWPELSWLELSSRPVSWPTQPSLRASSAAPREQARCGGRPRQRQPVPVQARGSGRHDATISTSSFLLVVLIILVFIVELVELASRVRSALRPRSRGSLPSLLRPSERVSGYQTFSKPPVVRAQSPIEYPFLTTRQ